MRTKKRQATMSNTMTTVFCVFPLFSGLYYEKNKTYYIDHEDN